MDRTHPAAGSAWTAPPPARTAGMYQRAAPLAPARRGMDQSRSWPALRRTAPPSSGDGPRTVPLSSSAAEAASHERGWTGEAGSVPRGPTAQRAGMDLTEKRCGSSCQSRSGDGPFEALDMASARRPRARGWTSVTAKQIGGGPPPERGWTRKASQERHRDGPHPHARGWTFLPRRPGRLSPPRRTNAVRAGMDRSRCPGRPASGDGPPAW